MSEEARGMLRLRLFGSFEALLDGAPLPGLREHRKAAQLLALLTLYPNKAVGSEWVAEQLWPGIASRDNLKHATGDLRRALGPHGDRLVAGSGTLSLDLAGVEVDAFVFDNAFKRRRHDPGALASAVDLYAGALLQDWYDDWVEAARQGYAARYLEALQSLTDNAIEAADYPAARRWLRRLVAAGDLAESLPDRLMLALIGDHRLVEAEQFYEAYRDDLREKRYGLLPPESMRSLYAQITEPSSRFVPDFEPGLTELQPAGGAVPLDSKYYVRRPADEDFHAAIARRDGIIRLWGPRQVGKTSLLARGLQQARQAGARVILTDFQKLDLAETATIESLFLSVAQSIADQTETATAPHESWNPRLASGANFERFLRREVLSRSAIPFVWGIDEADSLFDRDYRSGVFGLFRSWFNARALDPAGPWNRLTLIMTYSSEARLFILDSTQSPFNVGTRVSLHDFTLEQVAQLNALCGSPLSRQDEVARLFDLVGGHPYLVRCCLYEMQSHHLDIAAVEAEACRDEGIFGDHLDRMRRAILKDESLVAVIREILRGEPCPTLESFSRLRAGGVVTGDSSAEARIRCRLYETYLKRHLL